MEEDRVIIYKSEENEQYSAFNSFRIDDNGIKREGYHLLPWQDVQRVRAWVSAGDGNWGFDEFEGLEIVYSIYNGYKLRLSEASPTVEGVLLYKLHQCIRWFLPAIASDWKEQVRADYRQHYNRQQWLGAISPLWYPNKPIIYERRKGRIALIW